MMDDVCSAGQRPSGGAKKYTGAKFPVCEGEDLQCFKTDCYWIPRKSIKFGGIELKSFNKNASTSRVSVG